MKGLVNQPTGSAGRLDITYFDIKYEVGRIHKRGKKQQDEMYASQELPANSSQSSSTPAKTSSPPPNIDRTSITDIKTALLSIPFQHF